MENILRELDLCADFVRATWISVVSGGFDAPPGAPVLKLENIAQRNKYADSIVLGAALDMPDAGKFDRLVLSVDPIGQQTESGKPAWDMKPMLLGGPKARFSKSGSKYNIIPFRHGVPGSSTANSHFKPMPKNIYEMAKTLKPTMSVSKKVVKWGEKLRGTEQLYPPQQKTILRPTPQGGLQVGHYQHKSGIYEQMYKVQANYGKKTQNQYLTFRVVSTNSDPWSWWHPATAGQPHLQWIKDYCRPKIEARLEEAAKSDLFPTDGTFGVGMFITR